MALRGIRVIEMAGLAPGPFCGMVLSDFGATIIRVDKIGTNIATDCLANGKQSLALDLKQNKGIEVFKKLCRTSDVLLDTYRAGVMESLGLGPDNLLKDNPKLIYARLSGYGQYGSFAKKGGHDINYVALSGLLSMLRRSPVKPFPPLNLLADFAGGGLLCSLGILMALFERNQSGKGQVVDCNMVEGAAYLGSWIYRSKIYPLWENEPGHNMLDGGVHWYDVYETKDGKYMSVGAIEEKFYQELLKGLNLTVEEYPQYAMVDEAKDTFTKIFLQKTQKEWCEIFDDLDACVAPVLSTKEAASYPHNLERKSFVPCSLQSDLIPGPAPKLSRTPALSKAMMPNLELGEHTHNILKSLGFTEDAILEMEKDNIIEMYKKSKL